jgi:hypothetical protein
MSAEWYLFGGCNVLVVTTFRTGLLLFSFAFHSYYKDLVSTAAFTLNNESSFCFLTHSLAPPSNNAAKLEMMTHASPHTLIRIFELFERWTD